METQQVTLDRAQARGLYRKYREHVHYSEPIDRECMRAYQLLAQGRLIIKALESIKVAGLNAQGLPKLAIARATQSVCVFHGESNGSAVFDNDGIRRNHTRNRISYPAGSFAFPLEKRTWGDGNVFYRAPSGKAMLPSIPLHLRPKRGLDSYHVLWEAEWTKIPPRDPFLLRRIGKADLWLVVAMWDMTEVERAALSTRIV